MGFRSKRNDLKKKEFETFIIRPQSEKFDLIRFKHLKYQKDKNK